MTTNAILIVEDDPDWQERIRETIEGLGYRAVLASSHLEARAIVRAAPHDFDVILLDPNLTAAGDDRTGLLLLDSLRVAGINVPCIIMTGYLSMGLMTDLINEYQLLFFGVIEKADFIGGAAKLVSLIDRATGKDKVSSLVKLLEDLRIQYAQKSDFQDAVQAFAAAFADICGTSFAKSAHKGNWTAHLVDATRAFEGSFLPGGLAFAFHFSEGQLTEDLADLQDLLAREFHDLRRVVLPIWESSSKIARLRAALWERLQRRFGIDAVILDSEQITRIIKAPKPNLELRRAALAQSSLLSISPYKDAATFSDTRVFFGRERELGQICDGARSASFAVIGGRRMGKTSILQQLHHIRLPFLGYRSAYVDCSGFGTDADFLSERVDGWNWKPSLPADAPLTLGDLLSLPPSNLPLALLLDEVDKIIPADESRNWRLFYALRARANMGGIQVVLSGERRLGETITQDSRSPLFNFTTTMYLGPLDLSATEELVVTPMSGLEVKFVKRDAVVQRIYNFTSGHPSIIHRLCWRLLKRLDERRTRRLGPSDVDAVIEEPAFQRVDFLETYWEDTTLLERLISLLLAQNPRQFYTSTDAHHLLVEQLDLVGPDDSEPSKFEVDSALARLVQLRTLLELTAKGYSFRVASFPELVTQPSVVTIADLIETYKDSYRKYGDVNLRTVRKREQARYEPDAV